MNTHIMFSAKAVGWTVILNAGLKIIAIGLGLFQLYWLTNFLTPTEFKEINVTASLLSFVALFAGFGIFPVLQKKITNEEFSKELPSIWSTLFVLRLVTIVGGGLLAGILGAIHPAVSSEFAVVLFFVSAVTLVDYNFFAWYASHEKVWIFTLTDIVGRVVELAFLLAYAYFEPVLPFSILYFFALSQLARVLMALTLDYFFTKHLIQWGKPSMATLQSLLPSLAPMAASFFFLGLYQQTQPAILALFTSDAKTIGGFAVASTLVGQGVLAMGVVNTQMASMVKHNLSYLSTPRQKLALIHKYSAIYSSLLFLAYIGLVVVGSYVIDWIDRSAQYKVIAQSILPILGLFMISTSLAGMFSYIAILLDQEKQQLKGSMILCGLSIAGLLALVPFFGVWAAVWVVVIVSIIELTLLRYPVVRRAIDKG